MLKTHLTVVYLTSCWQTNLLSAHPLCLKGGISQSDQSGFLLWRPGPTELIVFTSDHDHLPPHALLIPPTHQSNTAEFLPEQHQYQHFWIT